MGALPPHPRSIFTKKKQGASAFGFFLVKILSREAVFGRTGLAYVVWRGLTRF